MDYVFLLFSDHTWYYARRDQVEGFCKVHKWKDEDVPKNVIIVPAKPSATIECSATVSLEGE